MMHEGSKVFIAGHRGMAGTALIREAGRLGYTNVITREREQLDLLNQSDVNAFFEKEQPDVVVLAAAKVGGIIANSTLPAEFIYQNLAMQTHVLHAAYVNGVDRLLFLGSSCIYPKLAAQPMKESALLTSTLEPSNEPYAIAKIAGIKMCESYNRQYDTDFRSVMPTNLYGPGDNYHPTHSHVVPALLRRIHEAKQQNLGSVTIWGSGQPKREFLYVDDMAAACWHILKLSKASYRASTEITQSHINIGAGIDISIAALARKISAIIGYDGDLVFDTTKPDGPPRKLLDVSRLEACGWSYSIDLDEGLKRSYVWFLEHASDFRGR